MLGTFRSVAYTLLSPKFYAGIGVGLYLGSFGAVTNIHSLFGIAQAYIYNEPTKLEEDQEAVKRVTGEYFSDVSSPDYKIFTYEKLCKGFYTVETVGDEIIYTGYGDSPEEFTYTTQIEKKSYVATSTPEQIDILLPTSVDTSDASTSIDNIGPDTSVPLDM